MNADVCFELVDSVREVITKLLLDMLSPGMRASIPDLVNCVAEHPHVAPHTNTPWIELSQVEGDAIAREVGMVAGIVIRGGEPISVSGAIRTDVQSAAMKDLCVPSEISAFG